MRKEHNLECVSVTRRNMKSNIQNHAHRVEFTRPSNPSKPTRIHAVAAHAEAQKSGKKQKLLLFSSVLKSQEELKSEHNHGYVKVPSKVQIAVFLTSSCYV